MLAAWRTEEWMANITLGHHATLDPAVAKELGVELTDGQTYGTLEGLYSIANTKQVAIVESTGATPEELWSPSRPAAKAGEAMSTSKDGALWDISQLTKVALAYCPTARCAVDLMGYLAVREGFYGGDGLPASKSGGAGETLLIADPNEAWTFEVAALPPHTAKAASVEGADGGHSAVWVAKRVPDEHFTYVANRFTIREVVEVSPTACTSTALACRADNDRYSSNFWAVAEYLARVPPDPKLWEPMAEAERGVYKRGERRAVDWCYTFGKVDPATVSYTNDRVWRVLSLFAPERKWAWPAATPMATHDYPFSAKPTKPLTADDFLTIIRDVYRGSKVPSLDLTRGLQAGPYGDPSRYDMVPGVSKGGAFVRAISMFRTSHSYVIEIGRRYADVAGARVWASQGAPHTAVYTPVHVLPAYDGRTSPIDELPRSLTRGSLHRTDALDGDAAAASFFWRSTLVNNWARAVGFDFSWKIIQDAQRQIEQETAAAADAAEQAAAEQAASPEEAAEMLARADTESAARSARHHQNLAVTLMTRLHDGYRMEPHATTLGLTKLFYPKWYLEQIGYYKDDGTSSPSPPTPSTRAAAAAMPSVLATAADVDAKGNAPSMHASAAAAVPMPAVLLQTRLSTSAEPETALPNFLEPLARDHYSPEPRHGDNSTMKWIIGLVMILGFVATLAVAAVHKRRRTWYGLVAPWPESLAAPMAPELVEARKAAQTEEGQYYQPPPAP